MRLLPQPVCRYKDLEDHLLDGAIFGLASNGTNPDACLVLEIRKTGEGTFAWEFGIAAMTAHAVDIKLDEDVVWLKSLQAIPANTATGCFSPSYKNDRGRCSSVIIVLPS